jgi:hypothetical protein
MQSISMCPGLRKEGFMAIGAADVTAEPFDPMTLAVKLRGCMGEFCRFGKARLD